jgi:hypothetical protein
MSRNFGIATGRKIVGGFDQSSGPHYAQRTLRDSDPFPSQPVLHRQNISHPPLNIGGVIRDAILGTIAGVALLASVFIVLKRILFG